MEKDHISRPVRIRLTHDVVVTSDELGPVTIHNGQVISVLGYSSGRAKVSAFLRNGTERELDKTLDIPESEVPNKLLHC